MNNENSREDYRDNCYGKGDKRQIDREFLNSFNEGLAIMRQV